MIEKRDILQTEINENESRKREIEDYIKKLNQDLDLTNNNLEKKYSYSQECERIINNTENAFVKILESSQTLLSIVKRDETNLQKFHKKQFEI